jgi:hypothetical protein
LVAGGTDVAIEAADVALMRDENRAGTAGGRGGQSAGMTAAPSRGATACGAAPSDWGFAAVVVGGGPMVIA